MQAGSITVGCYIGSVCSNQLIPLNHAYVALRMTRGGMQDARIEEGDLSPSRPAISSCGRPCALLHSDGAVTSVDEETSDRV